MTDKLRFFEMVYQADADVTVAVTEEGEIYARAGTIRRSLVDATVSWSEPDALWTHMGRVLPGSSGDEA